jgi:hypothetical protein
VAEPLAAVLRAERDAMASALEAAAEAALGKEEEGGTGGKDTSEKGVEEETKESGAETDGVSAEASDEEGEEAAWVAAASMGAVVAAPVPAGAALAPLAAANSSLVVAARSAFADEAEAAGRLSPGTLNNFASFERPEESRGEDAAKEDPPLTAILEAAIVSDPANRYDKAPPPRSAHGHAPANHDGRPGPLAAPKAKPPDTSVCSACAVQ